MTYKSEMFQTELSYLKDENLKNLATQIIELLPDYTFEVPASASGLYHPSYTNGKGGLIRHSKAAVRIAKELMRLEMYQSIEQYHDYILIALMLHDGWKQGIPDENGTTTGHMDVQHPKICCNWLYSLSNTEMYKAYSQQLQYIGFLVLTHMGQWNLDYHTGELFAPKPQTNEQMFVHLCDYLASRKCLEMNFEVEYNA